MNFAPFSFLNQQAAAASFNPNSISDLQLWLDFNNQSLMQLSGSSILTISSSLIVSQSYNIQPTFSRVNTSNNYYQLADSLSNPSLKAAKVVTQPTTYRNSGYNLVDASASFEYITNGTKDANTTFPNSTEFYVFNRGTISTAGYLSARWTNASDRGVIYQLNSGTPQKDIISYDAWSPSYLYYQSTGSASQILTRENNGATASLFNGTLQVATGIKNQGTDTVQTRTLQNLGIYQSPTTTGDTTPVNTYYCEVIVYNRPLTTNEKTQVWNYLSTKWNIPLN